MIEELDINRNIVFKYQDNNDSEGLFKYILIKQCNALGKIMPVMFEKIEDYTKLLLPDNLLVIPASQLFTPDWIVKYMVD